jgi:hypothetical protein
MVIAMADTLRMFIDGCGELVEPTPNDWRWRELEVVTKKPELKACKFPSQACVTQRWIPRREGGWLDFCETGERSDEPKTDLAPMSGRGFLEGVFCIVRPKIFEHCPSLAEIMVKEGGHPQAVVGAPSAYLEVSDHLTSNAFRVIGEH